MNPRRRALVDKAYDVMDVDGSGTVDLADMALAYDVSFHPDFIAKKKTKDQILREFLDVFDDGEKDGVVTRDEFAKYYSAISASIDNDDYFELMIRNAWRMSGGEGMAANTANKRVLVTGADGSERVVEVRNEMGLKRGDQKDLMGRLQKQGEQGISGLSMTGSVNNTTGGRAGGRPVLSSATRVLAAMSDTTQPVSPAVAKIIDVLRSILTESGDCLPLIKLQRALRRTEGARRETDKGVTLNDVKIALMGLSVNIPYNDVKSLFDAIGMLYYRTVLLMHNHIIIIVISVSVIDSTKSGKVSSNAVIDFIRVSMPIP